MLWAGATTTAGGSLFGICIPPGFMNNLPAGGFILTSQFNTGLAGSATKSIVLTSNTLTISNLSYFFVLTKGYFWSTVTPSGLKGYSAASDTFLNTTNGIGQGKINGTGTVNSMIHFKGARSGTSFNLTSGTGQITQTNYVVGAGPTSNFSINGITYDLNTLAAAIDEGKTLELCNVFLYFDSLFP
jgi:hypothetical protein